MPHERGAVFGRSEGVEQAAVEHEVKKPARDLGFQEVHGQELAVQVYAASLLAIKVDTPAERNYIEELGQALGLSPQVTATIQQSLGM